MIVIRKKKAKSKHQVSVTVTVCENPTPGTWGSHQLYIAECRRHDEEWTRTPEGIPSKEFEQLMFNYNWLLEMEKKYGKLHCEYCGKPDLVIMDWREPRNEDVVATADHFLPKSVYPKLAKDPKNLVVACYTHNNGKKDKIVSPETLKFRYPEERNF